MLNAKFQDHRTSGSEELYVFNVVTICSHGGHLGRVWPRPFF